MSRLHPALALAVALTGCPDQEDAASSIVDEDPHIPIVVEVTLDGAPVADARVTQGGVPGVTLTDHIGRAALSLDPHVGGEVVVMASTPSARIGAATWTPDAPDPTRLTIALTRFAPEDNPDYAFQDPGEPGRRETTAQCGHCHLTINDGWSSSAHRSAARNPNVQALYRGATLTDEPDCRARGGTWIPGSTVKGQPEPGRCLLGPGVLPTLNPEACDGDACDGSEAAFGACADCHAPGMTGADTGALGGQDLAKAEGHALDYGVHCDVCHRVEAIDLEAPAGVAGRLVLHRPSEASPSIALGRFEPLTFGPHHDVANPRMGSVQRDHFLEATLCAGCHELEQPALVPGARLDPTRWPDGALPVHSTFSEWQAGPLAPAAPCQSCHMPPAPEPWNGADLQAFPNTEPGIAGGWPRPPGSVRHHTWPGPRSADGRLLALAAHVTVTRRLDDTQTSAEVTVTNVGPGHALPTGEPLRALVLTVDAWCGDARVEALGGDVVPDHGGHLASQRRGDDWTRWPGATPGERLRIVKLSDDYRDYDGVGPFASPARGGRFTAAEKGLRREALAGERTIVAVDGDVVTLDRPLPDGDVAYRLPPATADAGPVPALAGAPGFAFARVLVGADGARMVPHFLAVDVASDNRLAPGLTWT
ncbi:MAG: hypothetical protein IT385_01490, partial [Deltaproteobacteria bacterium]|nr:hypothetical protein [Deltaproteobacteria bacterium]